MLNLGLYRNADFPNETMETLKQLEAEIKKNHPFLSFNWFVPDPTKAIIKVQLLGIETHFLLSDAVAAFRRLAKEE